MRYAQMVVGPAGSGKSTYCSTVVKHCESIGRVIRVVNLDPAAEIFDYPCFLDIRDLISLSDVMEDKELRFGPNGGLVYCMEYLAENLDWLEENLDDMEDDYFLFDCPGQIELYTHITVMRRIADALQSWNFNLCGVFLLDTQFMTDISKFFSGTLVALSAMINFEIPHVNVLTKMDLLNQTNKELVENFLEPNFQSLQFEDETNWNRQYRTLSRTLARVLDDYSLVKFTPLDITDEESISDVLLTIDMSIQYGENADVKDRYPEYNEEDERQSGENGRINSWLS